MAPQTIHLNTEQTVSIGLHEESFSLFKSISTAQRTIHLKGKTN
ncbi:unnamed protein product, partial [Rotaria sordida]